MKLNVSSSPVHVVGGESRKTVSISANGKAFRALTNNLYQNKIGSVVREISANAVDSQIQAGTTDKPFEVHLPDNFEPWFSVRDFGTGISPENMDRVFLVMFESTKDQSNDAIGAFGLGSKTPLAYTDQFSIVSYIDGIARMYSIFTENTGDLQCVEMGSFETDEPNGVEVKFNVRSEDYSKFRNEVADQLSFFQIRPTILNGSVNWKEMGNSIYETDDVHISSYGAGYGESAINILQGGVCYPLNPGMTDKLSTENASFVRALGNNRTYLKFAIGQIDVTISREAVEYNDFTLKNINSKIDTIREGLYEFIESQFADANSDWERACFINSSKLVFLFAKASGLAINNLRFPSYGLSYFDMDEALFVNKERLGRLVYIDNERGKMVRNALNPLVPQHDIVVYVRDTASRPNIRYNYHFDNVCENKVAFILEPLSLDKADECMKRFAEFIGGFDNFVKLSEVEVPKSAKVRAQYTRPTYYINHAQSTSGKISYWEKEYEPIDEIEDDVAYVVVKGLNVVDKHQVNIDGRKYDAFGKISDYRMWNNVYIIGIREADLPKIANKSNFRPLNEVAAELIEAKKEEIKKYRRVMRRSFMVAAWENVAASNEKFYNDETFNNIQSDSNILRRMKKLSEKLNAFDNVIPDDVRTMLHYEYSTMRDKWTRCIREAIVKRYPLLHSVDDWSWMRRTNANDLIDYVNMVDSRQVV